MLRLSAASSRSLQYYITNAAMHQSPRFSARGRNQWHRGFCEGRGGWRGGGGPIVSGDSHLNAVRNNNYGYRQGHSGDYTISRGKPPRPLGLRRPPPTYQRDDHRNWIYAVSQPPPQCEQFTVLSYNILADYLARDHRSKLYFHIPNHILDWEWRKKRLFLEFGLWSPDIMCLQEVDRFRDLEDELSIRGYAGIWKMRTGNAVDGCAIFWRTNRFELRHEEHIEYKRLELRDNVAQICVLESRVQNPGDRSSTNSPTSSDQYTGANQVVVCNIHVLYNPRRGEMKLAQVRLLLERAHAVSKNWNDAPVIVCGDFNCTPRSPLYQFISQQKLNLVGLARDQISGQSSSSLYYPRPYSGSGLYRPHVSKDSWSQKKDVECSNNLNWIDNHHKPQDNTEDGSQMEMLPSADRSTGMLDTPRELFSTQQNMIEDGILSGHVAIGEGEEVMLNGSSDDPSSSLSFVSPPQSSSESCEVLSKNPGVQLKPGGNDGATESHCITSTGLSQLNESVPSDSICRLNMDPSFDHELSEMLSLAGDNNILKSDIQTSVTRTLHEDPTSQGIIKVQTGGNDAPLKEGCHSYVTQGTSLGEGIPVSKPLNYFSASISSSDVPSGPSTTNSEVSVLDNVEPTLAPKGEVGAGISCQNTGRTNISDSSVIRNSLREVDKLLVGGLHSGEDCGKPDLAEVLPCTDQNTSVDIVGQSLSVEENSEEPNKFSESSCLGGGSQREHLEDRGRANYLDNLCGSEENLDPNFLKELLGTDNVCDSVELFEPDPPSADICQGSPSVASPASDTEKHYSDPYFWNPAEIEVASGNAGCHSVEHSLQLRSAYADVEDHAGTKDPSREPEVTSYNRLFMGTVDYIWYSEGLQTVKVLDTIPKHILKRTPGFPTHRWGSDHLALASRFAFTKGIQVKK